MNQTMIFYVEESDVRESATLRTHLQSLNQNEVDQTKSTMRNNSMKLYHLRNLFFESESGDLRFVSALSESYQKVLRQMSEANPSLALQARIGASIFLPDELPGHLQSFLDLASLIGLSLHPDVLKRKLMIEQAIRQGVAILEISDSLVFETIDIEINWNVDEQLFTPTPLTKSSPRDKDKEPINIMLKQALIRARRDNIDPVNLEPYNHVAISKALRLFAYKRDSNDQRIDLPVIYSNGQEARPFPFLALSEPNEAALASLVSAQELKAGMMSARHPEMDHVIDFYWFRNLELSVSRPSAETDEIAYQKTKELLVQARGRSLRIYFYQTGFPAVVIGFYRALVEELIERSNEVPSLELVPQFLRRDKKGYDPAKKIWH